jgi:tyrosyl-tRNA synthetase
LSQLDEPTLAAALREAAVAQLKHGGPDTITDLLVASGLSAARARRGGRLARVARTSTTCGSDSEEWVPQPARLLARPLAGTASRQANIAGVERSDEMSE